MFKIVSDSFNEMSSYLSHFRLLKDNFKELEDAAEFLKSSQKLKGIGAGRSGGAIELGLIYLKKNADKLISFYKDRGFENNGTLIAVSGSGKTSEVINEIKNGNFEKILVLTSKKENSPLLDAIKEKEVEYRLLHLSGREQIEEKMLSYSEQQLVKGESPTLGDLFEEKSLFSMYLISKILKGEKTNGHKEVDKLLTNFKNLKDKYQEFEQIISNYHDSGIYFISFGRGEPACYMLANRANHYGFKVFKSGDSVAPRMKNKYAAILMDDDSEDYTQLIEEIKNKKTKFAEPPVIGFGPKNNTWSNKCDIYLEVDELFYAPIFINFALRRLANKKGLTTTYTSDNHTDIQ